MLDAFAPGLLVGLAIAAFGAFLAGRNPGAPSSLPWAVAQWGILRHPVQLYEALALLAVTALVWRMLRRGARAGAPFLAALVGYGLVTWLVEAFRAAETAATMLGGLRTAQVLGLLLALAALVGFRALATETDSLPEQPAPEA
jgi:phosphatidylglycerol---prolipoprotein diacylglyceryl transferase